MRFSVIIPVHNSAAHLSDCVASILDQTFADWEMLLVDDGSTDRSVEVCADLARRDLRIRFFSLPHQGVASARNHGLREARGQFVTFLDSDDTFSLAALKKADEALSQTGCDLAIFSMTHCHYRGSGCVRKTHALSDRNYVNGHELVYHWIENRDLLIYSNGNKFYRRSLLNQAHIRFDAGVNFGEDRLFNYATLRRCGAIVTRSDVSYEYHLRQEDSLSSRFRDDVVADAINLHEAKRRLIEDLGLNPAQIRPVLEEDLSTEIHLAVNHLRSHWSTLDRTSRHRLVRCLVQVEYPDYLRDIRPPTLNGRLLFHALRRRWAWAVYIFLQASARV